MCVPSDPWCNNPARAEPPHRHLPGKSYYRESDGRRQKPGDGNRLTTTKRLAGPGPKPRLRPGHVPAPAVSRLSPPARPSAPALPVLPGGRPLRLPCTPRYRLCPGAPTGPVGVGSVVLVFEGAQGNHAGSAFRLLRKSCLSVPKAQPPTLRNHWRLILGLEGTFVLPASAFRRRGHGARDWERTEVS